MKFITLDPQITAMISNNYVISDRLPVRKRIETLINPSIETKRALADRSVQSKILKALLESVEPAKFQICSNPGHLVPEVQRTIGTHPLLPDIAPQYASE